MRSAQLIFVTWALFCSSIAFAGPGSSGGGNALVSHFVSAANWLLQKESWTPAEYKLLSEALESSRIVSVPVLMDPSTDFKTPVENEEKLIAYGSPNYIQLKQQSHRLGEDSWEEQLSKGAPLAHHIIHELFRASNDLDKFGKSVDDSYQISVGVHHLDRWALPSAFTFDANSDGKAEARGIDKCRIVPRGGMTYGVQIGGNLVDTLHWTDSGIEDRLKELVSLQICVAEPRPVICAFKARADATFFVQVPSFPDDKTQWNFGGVQEEMARLVQFGVCLPRGISQ